MGSNLEREVKLEAGIGFVVPALDDVVQGVRAQVRPDSLLQAIYFDTPGLCLMRQGVTLRHRRDRHVGAGATGERGWTLKLPAPSDGKGLVRKEMSWPGGPGALPRGAANVLRALHGSEELGAVARLVTKRRRTLLTDPAGEPLVEIDDDTVSVMDGRRLAARFREVEVEVVGAAGGELLDAVVDRLRDAGALPGDDRPKVVRALGPRATQPPDVMIPTLGPDATVREVVGASISAGYCRLVEHDPGVRLDEDPEDVHQARVATRRLRSDLRTFRDLLDGAWAVPVREELGWLAAALGQVRDADVLGERLRERAGDLAPGDRDDVKPLLRRLAITRRSAIKNLRAVMDSARYADLLVTLAAAANDPPLDRGTAGGDPVGDGVGAALADAGRPPPGAEGPQPAGPEPADPEPAGPAVSAGDGAPRPATVAVPAEDRESDASALGGVASTNVTATRGEPNGTGPPADDGVRPGMPVAAPRPAVDGEVPAIGVLPQLVRKPWRRLARAVATLGPDPADDALHEVRILAKRLRYASEAVAVVVGRPAQRTGRDAAGLQTVLGDHHDAVVAEGWLREAAKRGGGARALVIGQLIAAERQSQEEARSRWRERWAVLADGERRAWLG